MCCLYHFVLSCIPEIKVLQCFQMSQLIANQLATRAKLLKGDLSKPGIETPTPATMKRFPPGLPLPNGSEPRRLPPGLPLPMVSGSDEAVGNGEKIGDTVTQLRASIVGCHRETVRRETGLEHCPSSNLHHFVQQSPHSRHEYTPPAQQSASSQCNKYTTALHNF